MKVIRVHKECTNKLSEILSIIQNSAFLDKDHCSGCKYLTTSQKTSFASLKQNSMIHNITVMSEEIAKETQKLDLEGDKG